MPGTPSLISGIVRDAAGRALAGVRVSFAESPVPVPDMAVLTAADGSFSLAAPVAGTYRIACYADGFRPQSGTITVAAAARATLNFRLK